MTLASTFAIEENALKEEENQVNDFLNHLQQAGAKDTAKVINAIMGDANATANSPNDTEYKQIMEELRNQTLADETAARRMREEMWAKKRESALESLGMAPSFVEIAKGNRSGNETSAHGTA